MLMTLAKKIAMCQLLKINGARSLVQFWKMVSEAQKILFFFFLLDIAMSYIGHGWLTLRTNWEISWFSEACDPKTKQLLWGEENSDMFQFFLHAEERKLGSAKALKHHLEIFLTHFESKTFIYFEYFCVWRTKINFCLQTFIMSVAETN